MSLTGRPRLIGATGLLALLAVASTPSATGRRFFADDPIRREPETQDASKVQEWVVDPLVDLAVNLFAHPGDRTTDVRAQNISTIDEVPDSNWFTNRILARPLTLDELGRGPLTGDGPAPGPWRVVSPKTTGAAPGFSMRDSRNDLWFVSFDAKGAPEAATGAIAVATRIFWALGYWQVENHLVSISPDRLTIAESAMVTPPSKKKRPMRRSDLDAVLRRAHRGRDGTYRAIASRAVPGRTVGSFYYYGTRPDDPNDIVLHEHRRELRALKVFGAWTNLVDMKAGNTLDTVITVDGRSVVRHYLQDVGSTFGTGANGPHEDFEGWEYLHDNELMRQRLIKLGFVFEPWQTIHYDEVPAIGRFEGDVFDPRAWRPRAPTAAFLRARADDNFWAARRVAAFTNEMIRTVVRAGQYSSREAETHLANVLIQRRVRIAATYLPAVNPLVDFALSTGGALTFRNAAVDAGTAFAPPRGYRTEWARFDNATGEVTPLGATPVPERTEAAAPGTLPSAPGTFVRVEVSAIEPAPSEWTRPIRVYFRKSASGWALVGLERNGIDPP